MEKDTLIDFMDSLRAEQKFQVAPLFHPEADLLTVFFENCLNHAERIDKFLTLYRSFDDSRVVGFELKGVRYKAEEMMHALNRKPGERVEVSVGVTLRPHVNLLLTFYMKEPLGGRRKAYSTVYERAREFAGLCLPVELVGLGE